MDPANIIDLVSNLGLPVAMCIYIYYHSNKQQANYLDNLREQQKEYFSRVDKRDCDYQSQINELGNIVNQNTIAINNISNVVSNLDNTIKYQEVI